MTSTFDWLPTIRDAGRSYVMRPLAPEGIADQLRTKYYFCGDFYAKPASIGSAACEHLSDGRSVAAVF